MSTNFMFSQFSKDCLLTFGGTHDCGARKIDGLVSRWRLVIEARDALLAVIAPALKLRMFLNRGSVIALFLKFIEFFLVIMFWWT
jgi:hypothetical protein